METLSWERLEKKEKKGHMKNLHPLATFIRKWGRVI